MIGAASISHIFWLNTFVICSVLVCVSFQWDRLASAWQFALNKCEIVVWIDDIHAHRNSPRTNSDSNIEYLWSVSLCHQNGISRTEQLLSIWIEFYITTTTLELTLNRVKCVYFFHVNFHMQTLATEKIAKTNPPKHLCLNVFIIENRKWIHPHPESPHPYSNKNNGKSIAFAQISRSRYM